ASGPSCSTCATRATPRATGTASSATALSRSGRRSGMPADRFRDEADREPGCPPDAGDVLLPLARAAIAAELGLGAPVPEGELEWLRRHGACFITLMQAQRLRGCIGTLRAHRP